MSGSVIESGIVDTYLAGLQAGKLLYQRCDRCNAVIYYPRAVCPSCASTSWQWQQSDRIGQLYAFTHIPERQGPGRTVGLLDIAEGFRMMASWLDDDSSPPQIGSQVEVVLPPGELLDVVPMYRAVR